MKSERTRSKKLASEKTGISLEVEEKSEECKQKIGQVSTQVDSHHFEITSVTSVDEAFKIRIPVTKCFMESLVKGNEGLIYTLEFTWDGKSYKLKYERSTRRSKDFLKLQRGMVSEKKLDEEEEVDYEEFEVSVIPEWGKEFEDYSFDREKTSSRNAAHMLDMVEYIQTVTIDTSRSIINIEGKKYIFDPNTVEKLPTVFSFCSESQGLFMNIACYRIDRVRVSKVTFGMWVFMSNMFGKATDSWKEDLAFVERWGVRKFCVVRGLLVSSLGKKVKLKKPNKRYAEFIRMLSNSQENHSKKYPALSTLYVRKSFKGKDLDALFSMDIPRYSNLDSITRKVEDFQFGFDFDDEEEESDEDLHKLRLDLDDLSKDIMNFSV